MLLRQGGPGFVFQLTAFALDCPVGLDWLIDKDMFGPVHLRHYDGHTSEEIFYRNRKSKLLCL
jgi:hypothetical protein